MHTISVLHVPGCAGGRSALEAAQRLVGSRDDVIVEDVVIDDPDTSASLGFRGSPTVLIDGADIEPDSPIPLGSMG